MRRWLATALVLALNISAERARAQTASLGTPVAASPAATLGLPHDADHPQTQPLEVTPPVLPVGYLSGEAPAARAIRMQAPDFDAPPPFQPLEEDRRPSARSSTRKPTSRRYHSTNFGEILEDAGLNPLRRRGPWFESDHCFDTFISPITNPFLFEDPRSLTEVRPIFLFQTMPNSNGTFRGGNIEYFGAQFRVALTDRLSVTMNKLGGLAINPGSNSALGSTSGFAEVHVGPKYTFLRDEERQALGAAGVVFQIPAGRTSVYQDTGELSIVPYFTLGKNFLETRLGSLNALNTFGYSFRTDGARSEFFYNSLHLSWDWRNQHRFYPVLEMHWFHYTRSGTVQPFGTEGRNLANIGSMGVAGKNNLHMALGARYKFSERLQVGVAGEFPLINRRDLLDFRLTIDAIWRY